MTDCIFCKIIAGQIPSHKIYEDEYAYAFLDINPLSDFHTLVIPKFHCQFFPEVPADKLGGYFAAVQKVASAIRKVTGRDYNILNNNGPQSGQAVFHVHFHIIPAGEGVGLPHVWNPLAQDKRQDFAAVKDKIVAAIE